jgi:hypothetical protein|tara:strand:- start:199 stop:600 length:402 start_codon:yes stop_codon:yes gene_type:complete
MLCQKNSNEHTEGLWKLHQSAILEGAKGEKTCEITVGLARKSVGRIHSWNARPSYNSEVIPIHMYCRDCGFAVGSVEEDNADVLDGLCLECFREMTDQTSSWYDKKSYEQSMKILKRAKFPERPSYGHPSEMK